MNTTQRQQILDLLQHYKEIFLNVSLEGPYKEGERADELYKWQLITDCHQKTDVDIIRNFKSKNIVDVQRVNIVLSELLKSKQPQLVDCFSGLKDESVSLPERLSLFKNALGNLCGDKYKSKANDERTAAAFLACWNPKEYTFYKDEIYQKYCSYIGEQPRITGEKYPHYIQLIKDLAEIIKQDTELNDKFQNETKGLIHSDLLIAQNILWQIKDNMNLKTTKDDSFLFEKFYNAITTLLNNNERFLKKKKGKDFIWVDAKERFEATSECHYEFCADKNGDANHDGKHIFVEVHFEGPNYSAFENALTNMRGLYSFKWSNLGFRINNNGFEMRGDVNDVADKALRELDHLDLLIGETISQTIIGIKMKQQLNTWKQILTLKKNIILQGAPGTGKTYNTAALALSICGETILEKHEDVMKRYEELRKEGRIGFCTFHQSMDYEDFIEGIKPIKPDEGELYYKVEDGIFKTICANAEKGNATRTDNFKESWDKLVNYLDENDFLSVDMLSGKGSFNVELNEYGTGLANRTYEDGIFEKDKWMIQGKSKFFNYDQLYNIYRGLPGTPAGGHDNYRKAIVAKMKKDFSLVDFSETASASIQQNYVLVIDEINRGNVSKIFGELITLIEVDKRIGGDHPIKVTLPYSKDPFAVPSNLYIIGTMNTTDRSVGNIDYAVRRRFAFVTLKADRQILVGKYGEDSKQVLLFDAIYEFLNDDKKHPDIDIDDLMVGHSYFMADDDNELKLKLEYEIIPLIREYNKDGIVNVKKDDLEKAFKDWKTKAAV